MKNTKPRSLPCPFSFLFLLSSSLPLLCVSECRRGEGYCLPSSSSSSSSSSFSISSCFKKKKEEMEDGARFCLGLRPLVCV